MYELLSLKVGTGLRQTIARALATATIIISHHPLAAAQASVRVTLMKAVSCLQLIAVLSGLPIWPVIFYPLDKVLQLPSVHA